MTTGSTDSGTRKRKQNHSRKNKGNQPRRATLERTRAPCWQLTNIWSSRNRSDTLHAMQISDKSDEWRKGRRYASGTVAILSALCSTMLVVGVVSLSRSHLLSSARSGLRSSEATAVGGVKAGVASEGEGAGSRGSEAATMMTREEASASRKLSRRPELKTRGGQLAFARFSLLAEYPHDATAFTQGLGYHDGFLYESTGLMGGKSSVRKVSPTTGEVVQMVNLEKKYFGEGMVIFDDEIHSLTWRSKVGFTWDLQTFEKKKEFHFNTKTGQGWGITTDGESLIVSDGSQFLFFWDPQTMEETRRVEVLNADGRPLSRINELEMVNGYVLANVWFDDNVYKIDPVSGNVVDTFNFQELYPKPLRKKEITSKEAVLNGIAWDPDEDVLYVTGKLWPGMYKVKLHDDNEAGIEVEEVDDVPEVILREEVEGNDRRRQLHLHE